MYKKIGVFCASSDSLSQSIKDNVRRFGSWMGQEGRTLVYGGIACGLMETVAQAVRQSGGRVCGVVPQGLTLKTTSSAAIDDMIECNDLTDRKTLLISESDILVVLPGSVGTLDEAFTTMAGCMVGQHAKQTVFWSIDGYYDTLFSFLADVDSAGAQSVPWSRFVHKVDTLEQLIDFLK